MTDKDKQYKPPHPTLSVYMSEAMRDRVRAAAARESESKGGVHVSMNDWVRRAIIAALEAEANR